MLLPKLLWIEMTNESAKFTTQGSSFSYTKPMLVRGDTCFVVVGRLTRRSREDELARELARGKTYR